MLLSVHSAIGVDNTAFSMGICDDIDLFPGVCIFLTMFVSTLYNFFSILDTVISPVVTTEVSSSKYTQFTCLTFSEAVMHVHATRQSCYLCVCVGKKSLGDETTQETEDGASDVQATAGRSRRIG